MEMTRRVFLKGMAGILAAGVAPAVVGSNILMPVRRIWTPPSLWVADKNFIFTMSNPTATDSLLMSLWVEDERGNKIWQQDYISPQPIGPEGTSIKIPSEQKIVTINASWTES